MVKTIEIKVGCLPFHLPDKFGKISYGWDTLVYTSSDPNQWRDEDVEWICKKLANCVKKHPIVRVDYIGKEDFCTPRITKSKRDNYFNNPLTFNVVYETKVPRTTLKANADTVKSMILMECI